MKFRGPVLRYTALLVVAAGILATGPVAVRAHAGDDVGKAPSAVSSAEEKTLASAGDWRAELKHFRVLGEQTGYLKVGPFLRYLDQVEKGSRGQGAGGYRLFIADPTAFLKRSGLLLTLFLVVLGGIALNLTPCVLPMIPINLAILGAGVRSGSQVRGFALGAAYGAAITLTYGVLGGIVVLMGSHFGTIQSSPWFNFALMLVFLVLALAMFDRFNFAFSAIGARFGTGSQRRGSLWLAMGMGSVAALAAGSCVAPVVMAVLLLATSLGPAGLALPFALGLGMALPWPFAGAGLGFLPKPGSWMLHVKRAFGIAILVFALYHGFLGYRGLYPAAAPQNLADGHALVDGATNAGLAESLRRARVQNRPVFIYFQANWCKNCVAMEKLTFRDAAVRKRLASYEFIRYMADNPRERHTRSVLRRFGVRGFPSYVLLHPGYHAPPVAGL